ncbi:uncharacterized protein EMH_0033010 [Eimeria mitis]|uniref:Uncharacterized protein n=1 Tax=Eimeria mitis TaxID=44415 RepID=U6JZ96_9EIME|nr:uncharacterized protein EMH_0033010 [Eimeria mitis]CDJ30769.1 hypothetical protein, conserved [Eimeria mitis]
MHSATVASLGLQRISTGFQRVARCLTRGPCVHERLEAIPACHEPAYAALGTCACTAHPRNRIWRVYCTTGQGGFSTAAGDKLHCTTSQRRFSAMADTSEQGSAGSKSEESAEQMQVNRLLQRYRMLRPEDRMRLIEEHAKAGRSSMTGWRQFRAKGMDDELQSWEADKRKREEQHERVLRLREIHKPAHLRRRKRKLKRVQQSEQQTPPVVRPTLTNELTDFDNPYMLKREAIRRLLEERGARNALDESMIDDYLDRRPDLAKLRLCAKLPPEVVEPLAAFHGLTNYNFDKRIRLQQKVNAMFRAVDAADSELDKVLGNLEENQRSDMKHELHPFRNHFGFVSAVPTGTVGSITMGREESGTDKELRKIRYPTLQRVAHTLPKDPKYRAIVAHAIRVLERSRGWDFQDKVKAINTLVEVYNHLPPSATYERKLDEAFPVFR